ncbi:MAG: putative sulfate exporter family transporter, partial [Deltaproteobacteria bacterium]|nr:putative sulfate exporter family transporter [Deltaproteobacteria bacterium]
LTELTSRASKTLLKLSVVAVSLKKKFIEVVEVGKSSLLLTLISITATLCLGELLGRALKIPSNTRTLVSFGTAICGGSAIAAIAPVIKARDEEIAVSLATIFALNAVALILFPPLGHLFELSQQQFGLWAALAIHDTSSVVGASAAFGAVALTVGTTAKLVRALWIAPYTLVAGVFWKSEERVGIPLFILGFVAAAFINSWLPAFELVWSGLYALSKQALVMTLFLIGAGLTKQVLRQVGVRPLLLGVLLWIVVSITTLILILEGSI